MECTRENLLLIQPLEYLFTLIMVSEIQIIQTISSMINPNIFELAACKLMLRLRTTYQVCGWQENARRGILRSNIRQQPSWMWNRFQMHLVEY